MPRRFCEQCGHTLGEGARFCGGCGVAVPQPATTADADPPRRPARRPSPAAVASALLAACFVLFTFLSEESQRKAAIRFIDHNLYEPVEAINLRNTIGEYYSRI